MLGTRTRDGRMEGADESTVLWRQIVVVDPECMAPQVDHRRLLTHSPGKYHCMADLLFGFNSVTRFGVFLHFGQLFKGFGNN